MGVYKDRDETEKLLPKVLEGYQEINELQEPGIIPPKEVVNQLHVIIKSVRDLKWTIERDDLQLNDEYAVSLGQVVDNLESAINIYEPISDELEKIKLNANA